MSVDFKGFNEGITTFATSGTVVVGEPVRLSDSGVVTSCSSGQIFIGFVNAVRGGYAPVQITGYRKITYSGTTVPTLGYIMLSGDGAGAVKVVSTGGRTVLIVELDVNKKTIGVIL